MTMQQMDRDTTATPVPSPSQEARPGSEWVGLARTLGLDVFGPIAVHWWLTNHGWSEANALMLAGALPAIGIVYDKMRGRRIGGLSILVLSGIVLSVVIGLLTHDARSVLLEGGLNSSAAGLFALVTLATKRTLVELFMVGGTGGDDTEKGRRAEAAFARDDARRLARAVTVVFALMFFASAAIQFALAAWAPIDVAFAYNRFGFIPCIAVIMGASYALYRRARARGDLADVDL